MKNPSKEILFITEYIKLQIAVQAGLEEWKGIERFNGFAWSLCDP